MNKLDSIAMMLLTVAACGDDAPATPDMAPGLDMGTPDMSTPDMPPDMGGTPYVKPTPFAIPLSAAGPDQVMSAAGGPAGSFYLAGFAAQTLAGPRVVTLIKTTPTGPDVGFGTAGIVSTPLVFAGNADEIDVVVQPSGKILVAATVAHLTVTGDRDIAIVRYNADGTQDTNFGVGGIARISFDDAIDNGAGALVGMDGERAISVAPDGAIYVHGVGRRPVAAATDTDFYVAKLSVDGLPVTTWGTLGKQSLDIQNSNATPRGIHALADGSVIAGGYANSPGVGSVQAVLYKLATDGARDTTGWGTNGLAFFDPSGAMLGSNCRNAIALPDGKTLLLGSIGPGNMPAQDAAFAVLTADGTLDPSYSTDGLETFKFNGTTDKNDQFWGAAVSGDHAILVGWHGPGAEAASDTNNDTSFGIILPLR